MKKTAYTTEEITHYLLGECSETEREALEIALLEDDAFFTQVEEREDELIDGYVREQMPAALRERFAQRLRVNPALRERTAAAEILLPKLDKLARKQAAPPLNWRQALTLAWRNQALAFRLAWAAALLLFVAGGAWMLREFGRLRGEISELRAAQTIETQRAAELAQQAAAERERGAQLAAEVERLRNQTVSASPTPAPSFFATLVLTAAGVRGETTGTPRVTLKPEDQQLRLLLRTLPGRQPRYRAEVQTAADLRPIWRSENLKPTNRSRTAFTLTIPAALLGAGEYLVKLEGVGANGDTFMLIETNFVVMKK